MLKTINGLGRASVAAVVCVALVSAASAATTIDFDESGDLASFDAPSHSSVDTYVWTPTGGVGGTPGVDPPGAGTRISLVSESFDLEDTFASGAQLTISMDAKYDNNSKTEAQRIVGVGFKLDEEIVFGDAGELTVLIMSETTSETANLRFDNHGGTPETDISGSFAVSDDTWYRLEATYSAGPNADDIVLSASVYDLGPNGTSVPDLVSTFSKIYENALLLDDPDALAYFTGASRSGGVALDNFTVIPEPTTLALLGVGGLALLRRRRA